MKASGIADYDEEIKMEDIQNPDSLICQIIVFIASTDDFIFILFQRFSVNILENDLSFKIDKIKKITKKKDVDGEITSYYSKGPYFYCLENGIFEA